MPCPICPWPAGRSATARTSPWAPRRAPRSAPRRPRSSASGDATPVARPGPYTQGYAVSTRTLAAYTPIVESTAFSGIATGQAGTPYAQVSDLNNLRAGLREPPSVHRERRPGAQRPDQRPPSTGLTRLMKAPPVEAIRPPRFTAETDPHARPASISIPTRARWRAVRCRWASSATIPDQAGRPALRCRAERAVRVDPVPRRGRAAGGAVPLRAGRLGRRVRLSLAVRAALAAGRRRPLRRANDDRIVVLAIDAPRAGTACSSTASPRCPRST